jgi:nitrogen regulatory protein PII
MSIISKEVSFLWFILDSKFIYINFLYFACYSKEMVKDNTNLPFEVTYAQEPGKESRTMKRLAVLVKSENVSDIISSLKELNLEATIYDVKGVTKDKERVASGRGSGTVELAYNSRKVIATVVNSSDVEEVVSRMKKGLAGNKAVVMISSVDDLVLI